MRTAAAISCLLAFAISGCATVAPSRPMLDDVGEMVAHPQFKEALRAAPDFTNDALLRLARRDHAINSLP